MIKRSKKKPTFSILLPYNGEVEIEEAIKSIYNQTISDYEIIIIDDNARMPAFSTGTHPKIDLKVIKNQTKLGLTKSLNEGLKKSAGEFIVRLDSDDMMKPERLEKVLKLFKSGYDFVGNSSEYIFEDGTFARHDKLTHLSGVQIESKLLKMQHVCSHSAFAFRKSVVTAIGGYNEEYEFSQDRDLLFRLISENNKMCVLPDTMTIVRLQKNSISQSENRPRQVALGCVANIQHQLRLGSQNQDVAAILKIVEADFLFRLIQKGERFKSKHRGTRALPLAALRSPMGAIFAMFSKIFQIITINRITENIRLNASHIKKYKK